MNRDLTGRIHSIETFGAVDGPGIRYVVFFQGCPLRCLYCHNPDSWDPDAGRVVTVGELIDNIAQYRSFIKNGGMTLSGGEPLLQSAFAAGLLEACRELGFHTAVDTSGAIALSVCRDAVDLADLILLDIKAPDTLAAAALTGTGNENALELLRYCEEKKKPVWIRHVLLPGFTLSEQSAHALGRLLKPFSCVEKVELLPFHKMGEYKWKALCLDYTLADTLPPAPDEVSAIKNILRSYGLSL